MAKEVPVPFQVRFSPSTLERLRKIAADKGVSVHAEIIDRIESSMSTPYEEPEIVALKRVAGAVIDQFQWAGPADPEGNVQTLVDLVSFALAKIFERLQADPDPNPRAQAMVTQVVNSTWAELRKPTHTPLGDAGRALGVEQKP